MIAERIREKMKLEKFIDYSDKAMYIAKKEGRDRVIFYKELDQMERSMNESR